MKIQKETHAVSFFCKSEETKLHYKLHVGTSIADYSVSNKSLYHVDSLLTQHYLFIYKSPGGTGTEFETRNSIKLTAK